MSPMIGRCIVYVIFLGMPEFDIWQNQLWFGLVSMCLVCYSWFLYVFYYSHIIFGMPLALDELLDTSFRFAMIAFLGQMFEMGILTVYIEASILLVYPIFFLKLYQFTWYVTLLWWKYFSYLFVNIWLVTILASMLLCYKVTPPVFVSLPIRPEIFKSCLGPLSRGRLHLIFLDFVCNCLPPGCIRHKTALPIGLRLLFTSMST